MKLFIREITPPVVWKALGRIKSKVKGNRPAYCAAVYSSKMSFPTTLDDAWSSPNWTRWVNESVNDVLKSSSNELNIHQSSLLLAGAASAVSGKGNVSILDLGGGVGIYFPPIQKALGELALRTHYAVVDGKASCEEGRQNHKQENLAFFEFESDGLDRAKKWLGEVDVCNISGTLHYILDWREALTGIVEKLQSKFIVISRAPTPDLATEVGYVVQNITTKYGYCGSVGVVLIPSIKLIEEMSRLGYKLLFEQGWAGDAEWQWEAGCSSMEYRKITNKSFIFVKN